MLIRIVGLLILGWGVLMAALSIASLVFAILGGGGISDITCVGTRLFVGLVAMYVGHTISRRKPEQKQ